MAESSRPVLPRYLPPPYQDALESGRLILRDGSVAQVRLAQREDQQPLRDFFERLSPDSRRRRFGSLAALDPAYISILTENSNSRSAQTFVVMRSVAGLERIVATGSYLAKNEQPAEVAFAVDDAIQGKGLGTLLLERLAVLAVRYGFTRFWALTRADNPRCSQTG